MKKLFVISSLCCSFLLLGACSNQTSASKASGQSTQHVVQEARHLSNLVDYFKQKGFTVGEKSEKAYTMISAVDGFGINLNGEQVELYEFDLKQSNANYDNIKRTGKLVQENAYVNGNFMLAGNVDDKIVQTFKEFK